MRELLEKIGIEPERVKMFTMSAAMAGTFVAAAEEMQNLVVQIGPSPLKKNGGTP